MAELYEVVLEWDGDIIDIQYVRAYHGPRTVGPATVRVTRIARSLPYTRGDDTRVLPYLAVALAVHLALWRVATEQHPAIESTIAVERAPRPIVARSNFAAASYSTPDVVSLDHSRDTKQPGHGAPLAGKRGRSGARDASRTRGHIAVEAAAFEAALAKNLAREHARSRAAAGSLEVTLSKFRALGPADTTSGFDRASIDAPLYGGELAARGTAGLSAGGDARSAGGRYDATIGVTHAGDFSNGRAPGHAWGGSYPGAGSLPQLGELRDPIDFVDIRILGDIDRNIVRRYLRRRSPALAACFDAAGRAAVELSIGRTSRIDRVESTDCIERALRDMQFPHDSGPAEITLTVVYATI